MGAVVTVTDQGAMVKRSGQRILITKDRDVLTDVPVFKLERLILFGSVSITPQARDLLLKEGIDVGFLSVHGRYKGRLVSSESKNIYLRLAQYDRWQNSDTRLELARNILLSKLNSQISAIKKYMKRTEARLQSMDGIKSIDAMRVNVQNCETIDIFAWI